MSEPTTQNDPTPDIEVLQTLIQYSSDIITILDDAGIINYQSPAVERLLEYEPGELHGEVWFERVHVEDRPEVKRLFADHADRDGAVFPVQCRFQHGAGFWVYLDTIVTNLLRKSGINGWVLNSRDITDRKATEIALTNSQARLQAFSHHLVERQENERQRVARLLETDLDQIVSGLRLTLSLGMRVSDERLATTFEEAQHLIGELTNHLNAITLDLRPSLLEHLGLLPALMWYFDRFTTQRGVRVNFTHLNLDTVTDSTVKIAIYRITQTALDNVARHAGVSEVKVRVWREANTLAAIIEDSGKGFDVESVMRSGHALGLLELQERVAVLDGDLVIDSEPGRGTRISLQVGLSDSLDKEPVRFMTHISVGSKRGDSTPGDDQPAARPEESDRTIKILIADSYAVFRRGLRHLFEQESGYEIVGEVERGLEIEPLVHEYHPDVLLLDLALPGLTGLEVTRRLAREDSQTRVLILSSYAEQAYAVEALRSGAAGYALKDASPDELVHAVQVVVAGDHYLAPIFSEREITAYINAVERGTTPPDEYDALTDREREILRLVAEGHTSNDIADILVISPRTAEKHRANMLRKLGLTNQYEVIRYALKRGIISL